MSPKTPPLEAVQVHIEHPVWLKPVNDVEVTRHRDELRSQPPSDEFGNSGRAHLRYLPIHHAGEFVENNNLRWITKTARQLRAKLLAVAEVTKGLEPHRRRRKSDRRQRLGDLTDAHLCGKAVQYRGGEIPRKARVMISVWEHFARDGAFARTTRSDDQANVPRLLSDRQRHAPLVTDCFARRHVEHATDLGDAE